jgi:hypothetical protein
MKKTLVALAALAATASFAQVTITGNLDFAAATVSGTRAATNGTTVSTTVGTNTTSAINISAVEDIGGGMKVTAFYGMDPRTLANDSYSVTNNSATGTNAAPAAGNSVGVAATGLARHDAYVGIDGAFGTVRLGSPNSIGLAINADSSPLGTGVGSGYTGNGVSGTMLNSVVNTRYNRSFMYVSPNFSGVTFSALHAPGNDEANVPATVASNATVSGANTAQNIPNARKVTELGLSYANGPLKVSYANIAQTANTNATGYFVNGASSVGQSTSLNIIAANYKFGNTTVYGMYNYGDALKAGSTVTQAQGSRLAVKQDMGAIDLMASYTVQKNAGVEAKVSGLVAKYKLSKTASTYVAFERYDTGAATANEGNIASLGLQKSF